jgi:hypothetical protein
MLEWRAVGPAYAMSCNSQIKFDIVWCCGNLHGTLTKFPLSLSPLQLHSTSATCTCPRIRLSFMSQRVGRTMGTGCHSRWATPHA